MKVFALRSLNGERAGSNYCVAAVGRDVGCTCPDHEINGAVCKHLAALRAIGLVPKSARTALEAAAVETARAARRPAKELAALKGRIHDTPSSDRKLAHARREHQPIIEPVAALAQGGAS